MADKTFDVDPDKLVDAGVAIELEQVDFWVALQAFREGANQLSTGQGYLDAYNDVIQDVLRATGEAVARSRGSASTSAHGRSASASPPATTGWPRTRPGSGTPGSAGKADRRCSRRTGARPRRHRRPR